MASNTKESIIQKKKPKDDASHLAFSLTKDVIYHDDYDKLTKRGEFKHKKIHQEEELAEDIRRHGWWNTLEEKIEENVAPAVKNKEGFLQVKKTAHRRSPYVAKIQLAPKPALALTPLEGEGKAWLTEMERLRRQGAEKYKNKTAGVKINFLQRSRARIHFEQRQLKKKLQNAPGSLARWLFELVLSFPLGLLLLAHGLLIVVEKLSRLFIRLGRALGRTLIWFANEVFTGLVNLLSGLIIIPLKILTVIFLAAFRLLSVVGAIIANSFNYILENVKLLGKALIRAPTRLLTRALLAAGLAALLIVPLKLLPAAADDIKLLRGQVLGAATQGFNLLRQGQATAAGQSWQEAEKSLNSVNAILRTLIQLTPQGAAGADLLQAGQDLARAAEYLDVGLAPFIGRSGQSGGVIRAVKNLAGSLSLSLPHLNSAQKLLARVTADNVPANYRSQLALAQELLPRATASVADLIKLSDDLVKILGGEGDKRYAILFQNNNELRPAGGFIGSLALVEARDGRIVKIDIPPGGSYDFQGSLTKHMLAPKPLSLINPRWQLQDANWYPDWPTAAEKVAWFLENAGQSSVDGVIALQATTLQALLRILGPIDFPEYKITLNADNIVKEIQTAVELEYDKGKNEPKQYIAELTPRVLDKILARPVEDFLKLFDLIQKEVAEKNILFYFREASLNEEFISRGWEPIIINTDLDYLFVVHANIGGGKTDGVIEESWDQQITIAADGSAEAELTISRFHKGDVADPFEKANNVDYVRVYTPAGSELIDAYGFKPPPADLFEKAEDFYVPDEQLTKIEGKVLLDETTGTRITHEFGKTVFGNWLQVSPGKTATAVFKYKLPFKVRPGGYSLIIQKQAGARPIDYTINISYPENWQAAWKKVAGEGTIDEIESGTLILSGILAKDAGFAALFTDND